MGQEGTVFVEEPVSSLRKSVWLVAWSCAGSVACTSGVCLTTPPIRTNLRKDEAKSSSICDDINNHPDIIVIGSTQFSAYHRDALILAIFAIQPDGV
jgi:hypothetical protein